MTLTERSERILAKLPTGLVDALLNAARRVPHLRQMLETEYERVLRYAPIERPTDDAASFSRIPAQPLDREQTLAAIRLLASSEEADWREGRASGAVYHGDQGHIDLLNEVYALHSQSNPLHVDLWPSGMKFEAEIVSMTAAMLGADKTDDEVVGTATSGGTESIIMAMKAYRDQAGKRRPEMVVPESAHVAFDKAAQYFGYKQIRVPVGDDYRADIRATAEAVGRNTVVIVGSAPGFPHGVIDPIPDLSEMARERGVGFHTDACLGGFILPWAERLGANVPVFDFRLPGVTSMSVDTHKYGYAAKGASVVLYRGRELRHSQYFVATDWPGGLYYSPTMAGSRPGALLAAAWAALVATGEEGYLNATQRILDTGALVRSGIEAINGLRVLGDPMWVIAFTSDEFSIYEVMARMARRGWSLNGLHHPPAVHIAVTLRHTAPGVVDKFLADLRETVEETRASGAEPQTGSAPLYGMAATFPARRAVGALLRRYIDRLYEVAPAPSPSGGSGPSPAEVPGASHAGEADGR